MGPKGGRQMYANEGKKDGRATDVMFRLAMLAAAVGLALSTFL